MMFNDLPLRLFTSTGFPVTDVDGIVLLSVTGERFAQVDSSFGIFKDLQGNDLTDVSGHTPSHPHFDPTRQLSVKSAIEELRCDTVLYDMKGRPLTDNKGRPLLSRDGQLLVLFGPQGEPISDAEGHQILDREGSVVQSYSLQLLKNGKPEQIFDEFEQPLTDELGFVFLDLSGLMTVVVDSKNKPIRTISGGMVFDSHGLNWKDSAFDSTRSAQNKYCDPYPILIKDEPCLFFNSYGHPLTNHRGVPLCTISGSPMIRRQDERWIDSSGENAIPVKKCMFDKYTLNGFKNTSGNPILLFNSKGWPLTDMHGRPQNHSDGSILVLFNEEMDPIGDWCGGEIFDSFGFCISNPNFNPYRKINEDVIDEITRITIGSRVQYFNKCGFPLTNRCGQPLLNAKQEIMIHFDEFQRPIKDINGDPVFYISGLPVVCDFNQALLGPNGQPVRLFSNVGLPLTSTEGIVLKNINGKYCIEIDTRRAYETACQNGQLFDKNNNHILSKVFNSMISTEDRVDKLLDLNGNPLYLFNQAGFPLTDRNGLILYDGADKPLVRCLLTENITAFDGGNAFDTNGHICYRNITKTTIDILLKMNYDRSGRPLMDQFGEILKNRKGVKLTRRESKRVTDNLKMSMFSLARESRVVCGGTQLFDRNNLPVTDTTGDILYTSSGVPLLVVNNLGKPTCDILGGPVFDRRGLPATRTSACWKDQKLRPLRLFNYLGYPLTDYDGYPLRNIENEELILEDITGRPVYDYKYNFSKDCKGRSFFDENFKPIMKHRENQPITDSHGSPLRLFNSYGWPLTSDHGYPLVNARGKLLISFKKRSKKILDIDGNAVVDINKKPMIW